MKFPSIIFFLLYSLSCHAQVTVFNKIVNQIDFPYNIFRCGSNYLIAHGKGFSDDFAMAVLDSNGNLTSNYFYGNPLESEVLSYARKQDNGEILMFGHNFWDDSLQANISNYKAYVMVTDTMGLFKKSFRLRRNTTEFNRVYNGIYLEGSYYFSGEEHDSIMNGNTFTNIFLCKTDTSGNILWYKSYPQFDGSVGFTMWLDRSYDQSQILVGALAIDSANVNTAYYSYLLMQIDTNGNFLSRIPMPEFSNNLQYTSVNMITQISQIFNNKYLICGNREHYILDDQLNIIDSIDMAVKIHPASFGYQNLYDNNYTVEGLNGFSKMYAGNTIYERNWSTLPDMVKIKDLIPTYDGGYIAIILNYFSASRIIKTDCDGNYVNPINCWPSSIDNLTKVDFDMNYYSGRYTFRNNSGNILSGVLYDMQGRPLEQLIIQKGTSKFEIGGYASGIYIMAINKDGKMLKSEKIFIE
ncbi:MAG: hypothetical protein IPK62_03755 [Bacteroidetes bacterium]|nr:hypothetical protein [Bacteroidota bacterium]